MVDAVAEVAAGRGVPPAQVALAWLLRRPGVTAPIVGATKASHVEDALAAVKLELTEEEMRRLEEHYVPHPVLATARPACGRGRASGVAGTPGRAGRRVRRG